MFLISGVVGNQIGSDIAADAECSFQPGSYGVRYLRTVVSETDGDGGDVETEHLQHHHPAFPHCQVRMISVEMFQRVPSGLVDVRLDVVPELLALQAGLHPLLEFLDKNGRVLGT